MSTTFKQAPAEESRRYSKAKPLAGRVGVCPKSIFRWADAGKIDRHKINGRVVLFDVAQVERYIESCRVTSANA